LRRAQLRKWTLMTIGVIAVGLGMIGVFVPLLPTTPFLLLAAACFVRSSEKLYSWLIRHRWFGDYIRHYREHRAIPLQAKIVTLALMWAAMGYTAIAVVTAWWLRAVLVVIAVGVTVHILRVKTLTREMLHHLRSAPKTE